MTETETTKASNGAEAKNGQGDDVSKQIIRQVKSPIDFDHLDMFSKYNIFSGWILLRRLQSSSW